MAENQLYHVLLDHVKTSQLPNKRVLFLVQAATPTEALNKARDHGEQMHFVFTNGWEIRTCDGGADDARVRKFHGEPIKVD